MQKKIERKWLLIGAAIYGLTLVNSIRFIKVLPTTIIAVGITINLFMFLGFIKLYKSSGSDR